MRPSPVWEPLTCIRCVACVGSCPSSALSFRSNSILVDEARCTRCNRCVLFCPTSSLGEADL